VLQNARLWLLSLASLASALWAMMLIERHFEALSPEPVAGGLCGEGGACTDVLASSSSEIMGYAVSAPAVGMFFVIGFVAARAAIGMGNARTAARLGLIGSGFGLLFGGWLLYEMLGVIGGTCTYCFIMDGLTLTVFVLSVLAFKGSEPVDMKHTVVGLIAMGLFAAAGTPFFNNYAHNQVDARQAKAPVASASSSNPTASTSAPTGTSRLMLQERVYDIPVDDKIPAKGATDPKVTIAVFEDFECPFCVQLEGSLEGLLALRDDVQVRFYHFPMDTACNVNVRNPMHPNACDAAKAGVCAQQQDAFWPMHDVMFTNNRRLRPKDLSMYAQELGLDLNAFGRCMNDPATKAEVARQADIGAEAQVGGTPTFFLNGRRMSGNHPVEVLNAAVQAIVDGRTGRIVEDVPVGGEITGTVPAEPSAIEYSAKSGTFTIDTFEASIVDGKAVSRPGQIPARNVTWFEADAACKAAGKRLCTEEEWLVACSGEQPVDRNQNGIFADDAVRGRVQPYGAFKQLGWCEEGGPEGPDRELRTGTHPYCVTPEGTADMVGNVKEWIGATANRAAVKGGSFQSARSGRCGYYRDDLSPSTRNDTTGFRCCSGGAVSTNVAKPGGQVGEKIMDWEGRALQGEYASAKDLEGKAYYLAFWASWCAPCQREFRHLAANKGQLDLAGVEVIAISIDDAPAKAARAAKQWPVPFPIVWDEHGYYEKFDHRGVPTGFYVTADGLIYQRNAGFSDSRADAVIQELQALATR